MDISRADVEKVALLSRLAFSQDELEAMTGQLQKIVGYVDQLAEVDTDQVEPMVQAVDTHNVMKEDVARQSLPRDQALATAPRHSGAGYLVPAVLGD